MEIEVRLFATLRRYLPVGNDGFGFKRPLGGETTVAAIIEELKLPPDVPTIIIIIVNGNHSKPDHALKDGDVLSIFPPVAGG